MRRMSRCCSSTSREGCLGAPKMAEAPWSGRLAVVGIGLEGLGHISPRARRLLERAECVVGSRRHLMLAAIDSRGLEWDGSMPALEAALAGRDGSRTVLLASGDPNLFGAGMEPCARIVVAERLGDDGEIVRSGTLDSPPPPPYDPLAVVVVEREAASGPRTGIDESEYEHDAGQVTKAEARAISIAALDPARDDVVWDIGAGSGSVAIEAARQADRGAVYAAERDQARIEMLRRNLARHCSWNVEVVEGEAATVMAQLPAPDAVFIGGGGLEVGSLVTASAAAIRSRHAAVPGRLVANLATIQSTQEAIAACRTAGVEWRLSQVQVSRARDLAGRVGWEALNPVHVLAAKVNRP